MTAPMSAGQVLRLPLLDGIERLGVLELELPAALSAERMRDCRRFVDVLAQYVTTKAPVTDEFRRVRSCQPMSLAVQLQWQLLPSMTAQAPQVMGAGQLEPAYEVGGDAFDYAIEHDRAYVAIFDAMGHGVQAGLTTTLAVGAYQHSRRRGDGVVATLAAADAAVAEQFGDGRFVTAMLGELELELETATMQLLNAGHLQPLLLLRHHEVIELPDIAPGLLLGLGGLVTPDEDRVAELQLRPGDRLVLVTDGILDATNAAGEEFGEQGLADTTARSAMDNLPLAELAGAIARKVYAFQGGKLRDDASLLIVEYTDPAAALVPPGTAPRT
ncbi:MAG: serine/threonine-protein phosphatase [Actinomycetota bacterium]|nr:serine/threonine-protein phosphatase [Actinomycetota bacterium]